MHRACTTTVIIIYGRQHVKGHSIIACNAYCWPRVLGFVIDKMVSLIEQHYEWQGKSFILDISTQNRVFSTDPRRHWGFQRGYQTE